MPGSETPVTVTIALLGFALLTALLGARAGRRIAESGRLVLGQLVAVLLVAALSLGLALLVSHPAAQPSRWQAAVLPAAVFAIGLLLGVRRARDVQGDRTGRIRDARRAHPGARPRRARLRRAHRIRGGRRAARDRVAGHGRCGDRGQVRADHLALREPAHRGARRRCGHARPDRGAARPRGLDRKLAGRARVRDRRRIQREPTRHGLGARAGDPDARRAARTATRRSGSWGWSRRWPLRSWSPRSSRRRCGGRASSGAWLFVVGLGTGIVGGVDAGAARVGGERLRRPRPSGAGRTRSVGGRRARRTRARHWRRCRHRGLRSRGEERDRERR